MSTVDERLAELGLAVPPVPAPVAVYVPAVRSGSYVYTSGQLPLRDGQLILTGKVGGEVSAEEAYDCARQCALNAIAAVKSQVELDTVVRVVKATVYVASTPDFTGSPESPTVRASCLAPHSVTPGRTPAARWAYPSCRSIPLSSSTSSSRSADRHARPPARATS